MPRPKTASLMQGKRKLRQRASKHRKNIGSENQECMSPELTEPGTANLTKDVDVTNESQMSLQNYNKVLKVSV